MDNVILTLAVLLFGWLVMYSWGFRKGFQAGVENERDATTRRFIQFRIERFGNRRYSTRDFPRFLNDNN